MIGLTSLSLSRRPGGVLIAGAVAIILMVGAVLSVERWWDRSQRLDDAERDANNLAAVLMQHTRQTLDAVDQSLLGLASSLNLDRLSDPAAAGDIHTLLRRRYEATQGVYLYFILDPEGRVLHSSAARQPDPLDFSAAPYMAHARAMADGALHITAPFAGTFAPVTDKRTFLMVRRLTKPDGTLAGFVEAAVAIDGIEDFSRTLAVGDGSAVGLIHADGLVISRTPDPEAYFLRDVSQTPFMAMSRAQPAQGLVWTPATADQGERYSAYRQIPGTPITAYVVGSVNAVLAPWWRGVAMQVAGLGSLGAILLLAALRTTTYIRRETTMHARHIERLERLAMAFAEIFSLRDRDELIERATAIARQLVPAHQAVISFKSDVIAAHPVHSVSLSDKYAAYKSFTPPADEHGLYKLVEERNQSWRLTQAELQTHPAFKALTDANAQSPPLRGWLAAPLMTSNGRNFGLIQLSDREDGDFDAGDEATLLQLANVISISLEGLRLIAEANLSAAATQQASAQIAKIMASMSDAVAMLDADWNYVYVNDQFERLTGLKRADVLSRSIWNVLELRSTAVDAAELREYLTRARDGAASVEFEDRVVTPQGSARVIDVRAFPADGGVTLYIRDVTARREAEDRLRQAQKMDAVGQLTGGVAHDFNNLLTVIMGNADILVERLPEGPLHRCVNLISDAGRRASDLIRRLLAFARRQPLAPRPTNIGEQVREMESLLRRTLSENIDMEIRQAPDLWMTDIDPVQLENSVLNLVINARDAMPQGGKLTLETSNTDLEEPYASQAEVAPGQYVMLALTDTGTGMTPEVAAKAFDPFFTTKPQGKGTGLGLSMVFGYVKQSGGHVRIYSEVGHGTTVKIYLPRGKQQTATKPVEVAAPAIPTGHETVLMVEDEDMVREFVAAALHSLGYKVTSCPDAATALAALDQGLKPEILLTDVVLVGSMNGKQLSDIVRSRMPGIAVLYMSGYTEDAIVHQGRLEPGVHLLSKPFRRQQLAEKLRVVLALAKERSQNAAE